MLTSSLVHCVGLLVIATTLERVAFAEDYITATCTMAAGSGLAQVGGTILMKQPTTGGDIIISVYLTGFNTSYPTGTQHGFHVHEKGNLTNHCTDAGGHYNPDGVTHAGPDDSVRHVGDLGNVAVDSNGVVNVTITDSVVKITGDRSVVDRAFVVHERIDDLGKGGYSDSNTTGHAGARYGCCKIILDSTGEAASLAHSTRLIIVLLCAAFGAILTLP